MKRKLLVILIVASLLASAVPATGYLTSNPDIRTVAQNPTLQPGGVNEVDFKLVNDPDGPDDDTRTARNVRVRPRDTGRIDVETNELYVQSLADGVPAERSLRLNVPSDLESGTYRIPLRLTYEYDNGAGSAVERQRTIYLPVRVEPGPRFSVVDTSSTATVNGQGTLEVTLQNVGDSAARDSTVSLSSSSPDVTLGAGQSSARYVDAWERGENRTFEFETRLGESAKPGNYSLSAQVDFEKTSGTTGSSASLDVPLRALPEMTFAVSDVDGSLRVGETGTLTGTVTNTGPMAADDAVVTFQDPGPTVTPIETSVAVGSLAPGESSEFAFDVEVTSSGSSGPRQFDLGVRYYDQDDRQRQSDPLPTRADVGSETPEFDVDPVNATFTAGSGDEFSVTVTNTREHAVTDVSAKIYADSPLSTSDDEAFVDRLEPGESREVVFQLSAGGGATAKTYPVKMDFQYDDDDGDTIVSDTYQVPVEVTESTDGGLPIVPIVAVALVVLAAGGFLYYRRRG
ncbi:COG1361 S-layer family protein [Halobellus limi]|uniref:Conserved repeat domain-containing protein n=1 Tax=Halobellus limi TaxID=699433 RepID=A0A1H6AH65_9EURY|nr:CARDB domain-containing protein [Halobellus limi]QCC47580.1 sialidase [Halobellus limi]SEG47732.1 conserved repeat domain-containing protein [Halobellus limi]